MVVGNLVVLLIDWCSVSASGDALPSRGADVDEGWTQYYVNLTDYTQRY